MLCKNILFSSHLEKSVWGWEKQQLCTDQMVEWELKWNSVIWRLLPCYADVLIFCCCCISFSHFIETLSSFIDASTFHWYKKNFSTYRKYYVKEWSFLSNLLHLIMKMKDTQNRDTFRSLTILRRISLSHSEVKISSSLLEEFSVRPES